MPLRRLQEELLCHSTLCDWIAILIGGLIYAAHLVHMPRTDCRRCDRTLRRWDSVRRKGDASERSRGITSLQNLTLRDSCKYFSPSRASSTAFSLQITGTWLLESLAEYLWRLCERRCAVRVGPAKDLKSQDGSDRDAHDQLENQGFKQTAAFRLLIFLLWHRAMGRIRVLPDPTAMTSYNIRARTGGASVQFCTPIFCDVGELFENPTRTFTCRVGAILSLPRKRANYSSSLFGASSRETR